MNHFTYLWVSSYELIYYNATIYITEIPYTCCTKGNINMQEINMVYRAFGLKKIKRRVSTKLLKGSFFFARPLPPNAGISCDYLYWYTFTYVRAIIGTSTFGRYYTRPCSACWPTSQHSATYYFSRYSTLDQVVSSRSWSMHSLLRLLPSPCYCPGTHSLSLLSKFAHYSWLQTTGICGYQQSCSWTSSTRMPSIRITTGLHVGPLSALHLTA